MKNPSSAKRLSRLRSILAVGLAAALIGFGATSASADEEGALLPHLSEAQIEATEDAETVPGALSGDTGADVDAADSDAPGTGNQSVDGGENSAEPPQGVPSGAQTHGDAGEVAVMAEDGDGIISGTVTRADTGAPLEGVSVNAWWFDEDLGGFGYAATTLEDGSYIIGGLPPAEYVVSFAAEEDGFVFEYWDGVFAEEDATQVQVSSGQTVGGIDASLTVGGTISGTVTDEDTGAPVEGIVVRAYDEDYVHAGEAVTQEDGSYVIRGLATAEYLVRFEPGDTDEYAVEYWDSVFTEDEATSVGVTVGESVTGIDASLVFLGSISGTVKFADSGESAEGAWVYAANSGGVVAGAETAANGSYVLEGLAPGEYTVRFEYYDEELDVQYFGYWEGVLTEEQATPVSVTSWVTVEGIDGSLVPSARITGNVSAADPVDGEFAWVTAYGWEDGSWTPSVRTSAWGDYSIAWGLAPGEYIVGFEYLDHCPVFWDNVSDMDSATSFELAAGGVQAGVNANLTESCETAAVEPGTPAVLGTPQVGETLTADPGTWGPGEVELSYQWLIDGEPVDGATATDYVLQDEDAGKFVSVSVTGTKPGHTPASATSPQVGPVAAVGVPVIIPGNPTISGTPRVGETLTADPGTWGPGEVALEYQWNIDGTPVEGATSSTLVLTEDHLDGMATVTVTGSKPDFESVSVISAAVGPITADDGEGGSGSAGEGETEGEGDSGGGSGSGGEGDSEGGNETSGSNAGAEGHASANGSGSGEKDGLSNTGSEGLLAATAFAALLLLVGGGLVLMPRRRVES